LKEPLNAVKRITQMLVLIQSLIRP
jgi:hypothetical protein